MELGDHSYPYIRLRIFIIFYTIVVVSFGMMFLYQLLTEKETVAQRILFYLNGLTCDLFMLL